MKDTGGEKLFIMPVQYRFWRQRTDRHSMFWLSAKPALLAYEYLEEFIHRLPWSAKPSLLAFFSCSFELFFHQNNHYRQQSHALHHLTKERGREKEKRWLFPKKQKRNIPPDSLTCIYLFFRSMIKNIKS